MRTVRTIIKERGVVTLLEPVTLEAECQALVTILEEAAPPKRSSLLAFLDDLANAPLLPRSPEEIEVDIQARHSGWTRGF